ncbi:3-methyladenine DNA glycosylase/8-oxoguanine DNA glycosylase [Candidatus Scalindua japonica]|uniref:DNA-(apurinic or apyrimidinic site) lyase n=1 Tax=Candidatus Scalindua japonica TaxID=1284222 RepID=A0A286TUI2_9BACT|nr:DNA glycosylase [Candidatus Scalindua japonica]GAX59538.1 3-methyladenine DNA glycosylase/8-oxoguanine DNA glycosylase [Candidatus Scalindua japonica]
MVNIKLKKFNLEHTLECGQIFRINRLEEWYYVNAQNKFFKIRQNGNELEYHGVDKKFVTHFFSLNEDYSKILKKIDRDKYMREAIERYRGLRILRQDPWECLISFICSSASNIPRIKSILNVLSEDFGKQINLDKVCNYSFPIPGSINNYKKILSAKTGFRAKYIFETNKSMNIKTLNSFRTMTYKSAKDELKKLNGVGDKVADCVLLFSLGFNQAFPVDTWIKKVMQLLYFDNETVSNEKIRDYALNYFGDYAGYAQQLLFMFARNELRTPNRLKLWKEGKL